MHLAGELELLLVPNQDPDDAVIAFAFDDFAECRGATAAVVESALLGSPDGVANEFCPGRQEVFAGRVEI